MNTFRLPGAVSLSYRCLESPFHGNRWILRTLGHPGSRPSLPNSFSRLPGRYLPRINMMSLQRSLSLSSTSSTKTIEPISNETHSEAADQLTELRSPFPNTESTPIVPQPSWMQELMYSNSGRHSRASSIVSTRTRFSTTTIDDPGSDTRSIDLNIGGQYFRISRDGSHITDELPPPYSRPASAFRLRSPDPIDSRSSSVSMFRGGRSRGSSLFDAEYGEADDTLTSIERLPSVRANILDPTEVDMPSPVDENDPRTWQTSANFPPDEGTPERIPSCKSGPEVISVLPEGRRQRTVSEGPTAPSLSSLFTKASSPLRRRNGIRLPSLLTDSLDERLAAGNSRGVGTQVRRASTSPVAVRSAGPVLMTTKGAEIPESPTFIGRNADALFPRSASTGFDGLMHSFAESSTRHAPLPSNESGDENSTPPAMDTENDISLHYARLMRRLDRDHRKALHLRDKDMEKLRDRLNEVDTVYRQELRARDFTIEDLKKRLAHLEETQEMRIEKARNDVEDIWESRWKDRDHHLRERMTRIEEEARSLINGSISRRKEYS